MRTHSPAPLPACFYIPFRGWTALLLLVAGSTLGPWRGLAADSRSEAADRFFSDTAVRTFRFELTEPQWAALRRNPKEYARGRMIEGATVLNDVAIRLKGMGSFRPLEDKPSLAVKFDHFVAGQEYAGLGKLMFNNSAQDLSYLAEYLATGLFRDAHLPAARVTYAHVMLNGRDLGLSVVIEAMNKRFLKKNFGKSTGNLYEGYLMDIHQPLELDNGADRSRRDLNALLSATMLSDPGERFQRLGRILDVDRFTSFAAMEVLTSHWDGYTLHTNNYRIYHDPASDRLVFITHGLDWAFRRPNISIAPPMKSIVSRALFSTGDGRRLYEARLGQLFTNVFRLEIMTNRLALALGRIRAAGLSSNQLAYIEKRADVMRSRIVQRHARIAEQLAGVDIAPLPFDPTGTARPAGWRDEPDIGEALFNQLEGPSGRALHIQSPGGNFRASWRAWIFLTPGRYRFEGLVRTAGLNAGTGGAGLRISGDQRNRRVAETMPRPLEHDFVVTPETQDVELVCELRAYGGGPAEAWFDLDTLRVRKLP